MKCGNKIPKKELDNEIICGFLAIILEIRKKKTEFADVEEKMKAQILLRYQRLEKKNNKT